MRWLVYQSHHLHPTEYYTVPCFAHLILLIAMKTYSRPSRFSCSLYNKPHYERGFHLNGKAIPFSFKDVINMELAAKSLQARLLWRPGFCGPIGPADTQWPRATFRLASLNGSPIGMRERYTVVVRLGQITFSHHVVAQGRGISSIDT